MQRIIWPNGFRLLCIQKQDWLRTVSRIAKCFCMFYMHWRCACQLETGEIRNVHTHINKYSSMVQKLDE